MARRAISGLLVLQSRALLRSPHVAAAPSKPFNIRQLASGSVQPVRDPEDLGETDEAQSHDRGPAAAPHLEEPLLYSSQAAFASPPLPSPPSWSVPTDPASSQQPYQQQQQQPPPPISKHKRVLMQHAPLSVAQQHHRSMSLVPHSGGRRFMVDTLALVRRLEAHGVPEEQAEAITALIGQVMNDSMEDITSHFVAKQELQMMEMRAATALSDFKNEVHAKQEQKHDSAKRLIERLTADMEKLKSEQKHESDKLSSNLRLDLNLEKGRIKEEIQKQDREISEVVGKLDREVNALRTELETAKFEVIKYAVGTLVAVGTLGLGVLRILL
eukprot:TRINITY_DN23379_c0_g1_i1.p1 TRINITY_DN23379_c0_g1~~TRINITY_DN23379_c0_g1_i1.p1  ORF type:complete len:328 (+),score=90.54 TRINITY_DN23379_c0_g1_i1:857-1840(+)